MNKNELIEIYEQEFEYYKQRYEHWLIQKNYGLANENQVQSILIRRVINDLKQLNEEPDKRSELLRFSSFINGISRHLMSDILKSELMKDYEKILGIQRSDIES
jgi:hypothetical protein